MTPLQEALAPQSDQLNSDDLIAGPRTLKITGARIVEGDRGKKKVIVNFEGDQGKPWKPCKTMGRAMVLVWGITDETQMVGKSVTVYRDPEVTFGDQGAVGGIRISHMSHIDGPKKVKLTVSQGRKANFVFEPLVADVRQMQEQRQAPERGSPPTAAEWTESLIADVLAAPDFEALERVQTEADAMLGKLKAKFPDLHAKVLDAYQVRTSELRGPATQGWVEEADALHAQPLAAAQHGGG